MTDILETFTDKLEKRLGERLLPKDMATERMYEAMRYSVMGGGKRVRGFLVAAFYSACGGNAPQVPLDYACGMEMVHAASLIHDDLPCADNDDSRRGKPSNHKIYGEGQAVVAGDALFIKAFEMIASCENTSPEQNAKAVKVLACKSGADGMCGGQMIDLDSVNEVIDYEILKKLDMMKTSCLISASCMLGCIAANADEKTVALAERYGNDLGLAFQIRDDIIDVIGDENTVGKTLGKDEKNNKPTYVSMCGYDEAVRVCNALTENAVNALKLLPDKKVAQKLIHFTYKLANREK